MQMLIESSPIGSVYRVQYQAKGSTFDSMANGSHDDVVWHVVFADGRPRVAYWTKARALAVIRGEKVDPE